MSHPPGSDSDRRLAEVIAREAGRLRGFVARRIADPAEVEDVLQDVFYELVAADRLAREIDQVGAWLFRVARNRIIDLFRRKATHPPPATSPQDGDDGPGLLDLLPSPERGPDAAYARSVLLGELADALAELPPDQREVFLAHEVDGESFREIAARTGTGLNTLLSRKRYAVLHLRRRLASAYADYTKG